MQRHHLIYLFIHRGKGILFSLLLAAMLAVMALTHLVRPADGATAGVGAKLSLQSRLAINDHLLGEQIVNIGGDTEFSSDLAWGDADGDGDLDLAVANWQGELQLYLNQQPTFTIHTLDAAVRPYRSVAWGDMDGDGDLDLAVAIGDDDPDDAHLAQPNRLYENQGGGQFNSIELDSVQHDTWSMQWGDIDGDGDLDLVVGNYGWLNYIYENVDSEQFISRTLGLSTNPTADIALADFNGDKKLDIVVGNDGHENKLFINDGTGGFLPERRFGQGAYATTDLDVGDMNGDGALDVAIANYEEANQVAINNGNGMFTHTVFAPEDVRHSRSIAWGDYDGDGDLDLAVGNDNADDDGEIAQVNYLYKNNGNGNFASQQLDNDAKFTYSLAWGDPDNDGDLELAVANWSGLNQIFENDKFSGFSLRTLDEVLAVTHDTAVGDIDGDGDLDIIAANSGANYIYRNLGTGQYTTETLGMVMSQTRSIALGDLDNDGDLDIVTGNEGERNQIYENDGTGHFTATVLSDELELTRRVAVGDVNGDGYLDIAVGNGSAQIPAVNSIYLNDQQGSFTKMTLEEPSNSHVTSSVAWADADGDQDLDLAIGNEDGPNILYVNIGSGQFITQSLDDNGRNTLSLAWGDLDGDGDLDLVAANWNTVNQYYRNDGQNQFTVIDLGSDAEKTYAIAIFDVDQDGDLDIAFGNDQAADQLYTNNGQGQFTVSHLNNDNNITYSFDWGDFDGDGDPDLVVGNGNTTIGNLLYMNNRQGTNHLPNRPVQLTIKRPLTIPVTLDYVPSERITTTQIAISYTLSDPDTGTIGRIEGYYSLNGGGQWFKAAATPETQLAHLAADPSGTEHIFMWDTFASGFFGQADNVIFRLVAYQQPVTATSPSSYAYRDIPVGSTQRLTTQATTFPFQVQGTQIRVVGEQNNALTGTIVYRQPADQQQAFPLTDSLGVLTTTADGYLRGRGEIQLNDQLYALHLITETNNGAIEYYQTSDPIIVTQEGVQTLVIKQDQPLLLFNLLVSLEWDARQDPSFLEQLERDLETTSAILYDLTNGQAALGKVHVHHDKGHWPIANIIVLASNNQRPAATLGGIVLTPTQQIFTPTLELSTPVITSTYVPGHVRIGRSWNRFGEPDGQIGEDWPRVLAHELGHYLFFLPDNYLGVEDNLVTLVDCPGSIMTNPYNPLESEFLHTVLWQGDCLKTVAHLYLDSPDWETINRFYPMLNAPTETITGPAQLPLAVTDIDFFAPPTPTQVLSDPIFELQTPSAENYYIPIGRGLGYLIKTKNNDDPTDDSVIPLGSPIGSFMEVPGAEPGDRLCVFDHSQQAIYQGCQEIVGPSPAPVILQKAVHWFPEISTHYINSTTISVTIGNITHYPEIRTQLLPAIGRASEIHETTVSTGTNAISMTLMAPDGAYYGHIYVWVPDGPEMLIPYTAIIDWRDGEFLWPGQSFSWGAQSFFWGGQSFSWGGQSFSWGGQSFSWGAPVMSGDGQVSLFTLDTLFEPVGHYTLQRYSASACGHIIGDAYWIRAQTHELLTSSILFRYLGRDLAGLDESKIQVYYAADEHSTFNPIETRLDNNRNHVAAPVLGTGIYMLMIPDPCQTFLPSIMKP